MDETVEVVDTGEETESSKRSTMLVEASCRLRLDGRACVETAEDAC